MIIEMAEVVENNSPTVGEIYLDLEKKDPCSQDPIELEREMHTDYEKNIYECIERAKKVFPFNFYVVVITKKERLMKNVLRNYFSYRKSCPTPQWDQAVYCYNYNGDGIEFLWVIPSKDTCKLFLNNALSIASEEKELLKYILDFEDGTLLRKSKGLNGESSDSILLKK